MFLEVFLVNLSFFGSFWLRDPSVRVRRATERVIGVFSGILEGNSCFLSHFWEFEEIRHFRGSRREFERIPARKKAV